VALRFSEMHLEGRAQLGVRGRLRQLRERLRQLFLGVVGVAQFVDECVMERSCFGHGRVLLSEWHRA